MSLNAFFRTIALDEEILRSQLYYNPKNLSILQALQGLECEKQGNIEQACYFYNLSGNGIALDRINFLNPPSPQHTLAPMHSPSQVMSFHAPTTIHFNSPNQQNTTTVSTPPIALEEVVPNQHMAKNVLKTRSESAKDVPSEKKRPHKKNAHLIGRRLEKDKINITLQMIAYCQQEFDKLEEILTIDKFAYFFNMSTAGVSHRLIILRERGLLGAALQITDEGKEYLLSLTPLQNPVKITLDEIATILPSRTYKKQKVEKPAQESDPYLSQPSVAMVFSSIKDSSSPSAKTLKELASVSSQNTTATQEPSSKEKMSFKFLMS